MTLRELFALPPAQMLAFGALCARGQEDPMVVLERSYIVSKNDPYLAVPDFNGMYVGIEPDGYTHT